MQSPNFVTLQQKKGGRTGNIAQLSWGLSLAIGTANIGTANNPIPYGISIPAMLRGGCFSPPQTDIANYGVFCIENMLFYYLTFHITGLPNFWRKNNLKFLGGTPPSGPLKI